MFNPKRPHGIVYNHPTIAYEQDGKCYGLDGQEVVETAEPKRSQSEIMKASWAKRKHASAPLAG